jgi:hypothetical protein
MHWGWNHRKFNGWRRFGPGEGGADFGWIGSPSTGALGVPKNRGLARLLRFPGCGWLRTVDERGGWGADEDRFDSLRRVTLAESLENSRWGAIRSQCGGFGGNPLLEG